LTDAEISEMTQWFLEHTIEDQGFRRTVEPKIVLEVAFNNMMQSDRHDSGYALRFRGSCDCVRIRQRTRRIRLSGAGDLRKAKQSLVI